MTRRSQSWLFFQPAVLLAQCAGILTNNTHGVNIFIAKDEHGEGALINDYVFG